MKSCYLLAKCIVETITWWQNGGILPPQPFQFKNPDSWSKWKDGFFQIRVSVILERAKFNRRYQKEGEKADEYIVELYNLVETCKYGEQKEEMLRDRLVVGIRDSALSEFQTKTTTTVDVVTHLTH